MGWAGNYSANQTVRLPFPSTNANGTPYALANGTVTCYRLGNTTEFSDNITLTASFDSRPGFNLVNIETSLNANFTTGDDYGAVLTVGDADGTSVANMTLDWFSIENRHLGTTAQAAAVFGANTSAASASTHAANANTTVINVNNTVQNGSFTAADRTMLTTINTTATNANSTIGTANTTATNINQTVTAMNSTVNTINTNNPSGGSSGGGGGVPVVTINVPFTHARVQPPSSATTLTALCAASPTNVTIGSNATQLWLQAETAGTRIEVDGSTANATTSMLLPAGQSIILKKVNQSADWFTGISVIRDSANANLTVSVS